MTQAKTAKQKEQVLPLVVSAKTGLTPADSAVMKTMPKDYMARSVGEALDYLLQQKGLEREEVSLAKSIRREMKADNYVVVVNGRNAELTDKVADYVARKEHQLPNQQVRPYHALEIEVSAVQEGGRYLF